MIMIESVSDFFLISPGDGEEHVYSPVIVNATLHCAVNNTYLAWEVDGLALDSPSQGVQLNSRGIFQRGPTVSSDGVTSSSVIVFGSRELNNNTRICCQYFVNELKENCTTLIVYGNFLPFIQDTENQFFVQLFLGRPSPSRQVSLQNVGGVNLINISWTATTMTGVNQSYIIVFDDHIIKTTYLYHIFHQEITSADAIVNCDLYLAFVKAVNGAGESDPSNNVSIPSLPDIGPVTASLTHQVWKYDGQIRVNISFQVRHYNNYYVHKKN